MKAKINALERKLDLAKLELYRREESNAAFRHHINEVEDELEELKFALLEKELEQCSTK